MLPAPLAPAALTSVQMLEAPAAPRAPAQTRKAEGDDGHPRDRKKHRAEEDDERPDDPGASSSTSTSTPLVLVPVPPTTLSGPRVPTMPTRAERAAQRLDGPADVDMAMVAARSTAGRWATTARRDGEGAESGKHCRRTVSEVARPGKAAQTAQKLKGSIDDGAATSGRRPDISEIYSPPRLTAVASRHGLQPGWSLDLTTRDQRGEAWDFSKTSRRQDARELLERSRPGVLIGSPMCTAFSALQALSAHRRTPEENRRLLVEAEVHLRFCCELYERQLKRGAFFVHEHPATATSWRCECVRRLMAIPGVIATVADQCQYGLVSVDKEGPGPARKTTRFLTNSPRVAEELGRRCPGDHRHVQLINGRAAAAQRYPAELCEAICRGAAAQLRPRSPLASRDARETREKIKERTTEEKIRRKGLGVQEICTLTHQDTEAWDDVKHVWLDPSKVKEARKEEMEYVRKMRVWDKVPRASCIGKPIPVRWVDTNKGTEAEPNYRSRIVAKELKATSPGDPVDLYAATPPLEAVKMIISHAASGDADRVLMIIDIRRAYFNAPTRRTTYVDIPPEDWEPGDDGKCARLNVSLYGTRDAARNWEEELTKFLSAQGASIGKSCPCVYEVKESVKIAVHGDDIVCAGKPDDIDWLRAQFEKKYEIRVQELSNRKQGSTDIKILNRIVRRTIEGITIEADPRHATAIIEHLELSGANGVSTPCEVQKSVRWTEGPDAGCEIMEPEGSAPLGSERARLYRGIAARLNYLAQDRPDLKLAALRASRNMSEPHERDFEILKRVGRYLISRPRAACIYKWQKTSKNIWVCTDSDWAGDKQTRKSTTGGCMWHGRHLLKVWAKTQHAISLSSAEAELYAAVHGTAEALGMQSLMKDLGMTASVNVGMDASAALGLINRQGLGKARHIETQWLWIQQATREGRVLMNKIPGKENPADLFTKPLNQEMIDGFMKSLGFYYPL